MGWRGVLCAALGWALSLPSMALPGGERLTDGVVPTPEALAAFQRQDGLVAGVVEQIDVARGSLVIGGQRLGWDSARLRIVQAGAPAAVSGLQAGPVLAQLRPGQAIRYALSGAGRGQIILIYLDSVR
jgi:hypothetical protein